MADTFRNHHIVLYPDCVAHMEALNKIRESADYCAILHDKDTDEDGNPKKEHFHIIIKYTNARSPVAVAKEFGYEERLRRPCNSLDRGLRYLVHADNPEKYQYDLEECFGTLVPRLAKLLDDTDEGQRAYKIFDIINSVTGHITYTWVFQEACRQGLYSDFRRLGAGVIYLIKEHNQGNYANFDGDDF